MSRFFTPSVGALALTLGFVLACSGVTDRLKQALADQFEIAIADSLGVDPSEVEITPKQNGRWALDSPRWDAECGLGPSAKRPKKFLFVTGPELMADCAIDAADCTDVLGLPCGESGTTIHLVAQLYNDGTSAPKLIGRRRQELEEKGWKVAETRDPDEPNATLLTARKGAQVKAVAMIAEDANGGGNGTEILVAPAR